MEEALVLLNDGGAPPLAPALQQEIKESLQDLKPQCVLDHLKVNLPAGLHSHMFHCTEKQLATKDACAPMFALHLNQ